MGSAKIVIRERDLSGFVPAFAGVYGALAHPAKKGRVMQPILTTSESNFIARRGLPDPKLGSAPYTAFAFHSQSDKLWSVRVTHTNAALKADGTRVREDANLSSDLRFKGEARYSGALVRAITSPVDTVNPEAFFYPESMVMLPLNLAGNKLGLVEDELEAYNFPDYFGTRAYAELPYAGKFRFTMANPSTKSIMTNTDGIEVGDLLGTAENAMQLWSGVYGTFGLHTVTEKGVTPKTYHILTLSEIVAVGEGQEIRKLGLNGEESYVGSPYTVYSRTSDQVYVNNSDLIGEGDTVVVNGTTATVLAKEVQVLQEPYITVSPSFEVQDSAWSLFKVEHYEIEKRDAFLIVGDAQGLYYNKLSYGIEKSKNYDYAFTIVVYYNGVEVERFVDCSRSHQVDGLGAQMFLEDKINGKSEYIRVYNNEALDESILPKTTDYAYWRETAEDIFVSAGVLTTESVNQGDLYIRTDASLPIGTRIRVGTSKDEYKISDVSNGQLILDRPFLPARANQGTEIKAYSHTENKPITLLTTPLPGVSIASPYNVGTKTGRILDAGANFNAGGDDGASITVYDLMLGYDLFSNREKYPVTLIMDGGFAHPALAQKLTAICEKRDDCFAYLSMDPNAEKASNYLKAMNDYNNSTMLNSSYASIFAGWVEVADPYNQTKVMISPVGFAMASQSYTATNFAMWYPAAGWQRGKLMALGVSRTFEEGERDYLEDLGICAIRYAEGAGLVIWSNATTLKQPSVLQSRHVRMLIIVIKSGLRKYLEGKIYDLNTERGRTMIEASIKAYMRDEIGDGVYDYNVAVNGYTTTTDIANDRVKVFLGITPTKAMKTFEVDLTLFSANQKIEVL